MKPATDEIKRHGFLLRLYCLSLDARTLTIHLSSHPAITCTDIYKSTKTRGLRTNESRSKSGNNIQQKRQKIRHRTSDTDSRMAGTWGKDMENENTRKYRKYTRKYKQINTPAHQVNAGNIVIHFYKKLKMI